MRGDAVFCLFIAPNQTLTSKKRKGGVYVYMYVCMYEMITAYYVAYTVFLCLSSIQVVVDLVKDWHRHIRSSRKTRSERK